MAGSATVIWVEDGILYSESVRKDVLGYLQVERSSAPIASGLLSRTYESLNDPEIQDHLLELVARQGLERDV